LVFEVETLVASCRKSLLEGEPRRVVRDILVRTLERSGPVAERLGRSEGGLEVLFNSPQLTVLNVVWAPRMSIYPHDHRMWAVIGIYGGAEDNTLFRRGPQGLVKSGAKVLREGEVLSLGADAIHSVENPVARFTGAIHVYGGDFLKQPRSQWDHEGLQEQPYDAAQVRRVFHEANTSWVQEASMRACGDAADPT
jgi:predicted metal-dependent enzyme (double-stranded beta helix superfamily)